MGAFMKSVDTILWGRKTYAKGIEMGMKAGGFCPKIKNYLFSRQPQGTLLHRFEVVQEPIKPLIRRLRSAPGKDIWLMGGSEIIASFLDEGEIDEFSIHVIPVLIGDGIPLIKPRHRLIPLRLLSTKNFPIVSCACNTVYSSVVVTEVECASRELHTMFFPPVAPCWLQS